MERQAERGERKRRAWPALLVIIPIALAGCVEERPAYVLNPERSEAPATREHAFTVTVREGDSLSRIAQRCDTSADEIARLNDLDESRPIYPGQVLRVPSEPRGEAAELPRPTPRPRLVEARYDLPRPTPRPSRADAPQPARDTESADQNRSSWWQWWTKPGDDAQADVSTGKFIWPVQGRIIEGFGHGEHGERNDGINIATAEGAPIRAAASGVVTYTGNELKDYGNLVLIKHSDGFVTAYAHAGSIKVSRGDRVERGQIIATAGRTGDVDRPQLHFEIRKGVQAVDPERYLSSDRAS